jgi:hypothetical protein
MRNSIALPGAASRFSTAPSLFAQPKAAPANHCSTEFEPFFDHARVAVAPPKGGLLAMVKPMTLPFHEYRDSVVACGTPARLAERLRRRAFAQHFGFIFSVLDGVRAGGPCLGTRSPRHFQGIRHTRGTSHPIARHGRNRMRRHVLDVVDLAIMKNTHE